MKSYIFNSLPDVAYPDVLVYTRVYMCYLASLAYMKLLILLMNPHSAAMI